MSYPLSSTDSVLIFSDLDATLLDHHNYSFAAAAPALNKLKQAGVPVILNTSKTAAELKEIHKQMQLSAPFIVENGAAIFIPHDTFKCEPLDATWQDGYWVKTFASPRSHWQALLAQLEREFTGEFECFSKMSTARISELTGLSPENALLAATRLYGEPVHWLGSGSQRDKFVEQLQKRGATPLLGGRFLHISGNTNKGKALLWLEQEYQRQWQVEHSTTIALGDSNNDIAMLEVADVAVRVRSPVHAPPELKRKQAVYTTALTGPDGWREAIQMILPTLFANTTQASDK